MERQWIKINVLSIVTLLVFIIACDQGAQFGSGDYDPPEPVEYTYTVPEEAGDGWSAADLRESSANIELIEEAVSSIWNGGSHDVHSFLVVLNNELVLEEYFRGMTYYSWSPFGNELILYDKDDIHYLASATKSFASALVGIAVDQGLITGMDVSISGFFPGYTGRNTQITLYHALTMTDGLNWDDSEDYIGMTRSNDWYGYVLKRNAAREPEVLYNYNTGMSTLLGGVVDYVAPGGAVEFADEYLFQPLGITNYRWYAGYPSGASIDETVLGPRGELPTGAGLWLRPRDMAKFGQLFLNKGMWNGTRIISEEWVEESTAEHVATGWGEAEHKGYGYHWWRTDFIVDNVTYEAYEAWGWGEQHIYVIEDLNLIVVTTGLYSDSPGPFSIYDYINDFIIPALVSGS